MSDLVFQRFAENDAQSHFCLVCGEEAKHKITIPCHSGSQNFGIALCKKHLRDLENGTKVIAAYPDAGPKSRIKYLLEGVAIHTELAADCRFDLRHAETEAKQDEYDAEATKHYNYRNENMRKIWKILDEELIESSAVIITKEQAQKALEWFGIAKEEYEEMTPEDWDARTTLRRAAGEIF